MKLFNSKDRVEIMLALWCMFMIVLIKGGL